MKRLIFVLIACLLTVGAYAERVHQVNRGETFASIARRYGVSEQALKDANPRHKTCITGLKLTIPDPPPPPPAPKPAPKPVAQAAPPQQGPAAAQQRPATQQTLSPSKTVVRKWTVNTGNGGRMENTEFADGRIVTVTHMPCILCHGKGVCGVCYGKGQTYNRAVNQWYMCSYCLGTGRCPTCKGDGDAAVTSVTQNGVSMGISENGKVAISDGSSGSSSSSSSSSSKERSSSSSTREKVSDRYGYIDCHLCHGTGKCGSCGGNTRLYGSYHYNPHTCPNCLGHITDKREDWGVCHKCNGRGKVYDLK